MVLLANGSSGVSSAQYGSQLANLRYFVYDKGVQAFQYNVAFEMIIENESSQGLNLTSAGKLKIKFVFGETGLMAYLSEWSIFIYCWVILQKKGWFENKPHLLISMLW